MAIGYIFSTFTMFESLSNHNLDSADEPLASCDDGDGWPCDDVRDRSAGRKRGKARKSETGKAKAGRPKRIQNRDAFRNALQTIGR